MDGIEHSHKNYLRGGNTSYSQWPQDVQSFNLLIFVFFFLGEKNAIISECHSEKAVCCSTGPMPRIVSSVEITRISWADSLIGTSAWHSSALCGFCRYIHYELELQDRNTVYLLKRTALTTIFYYLVVSLENVSVYHWESRCK